MSRVAHDPQRCDRSDLGMSVLWSPATCDAELPGKPDHTSRCRQVQQLLARICVLNSSGPCSLALVVPLSSPDESLWRQKRPLEPPPRKMAVVLDGWCTWDRRCLYLKSGWRNTGSDNKFYQVIRFKINSPPRLRSQPPSAVVSSAQAKGRPTLHPALSLQSGMSTRLACSMLNNKQQRERDRLWGFLWPGPVWQRSCPAKLRHADLRPAPTAQGAACVLRSSPPLI